MKLFVSVSLILLLGCETEVKEVGDVVFGNETQQSSGDAKNTEITNADEKVTQGDVGYQPEKPFASPEGVAVSKDYVFIANSNYSFEGDKIKYDKGFVTVVRLDDNKIIGMIAPSDCTNAQEVKAKQKYGYVLCSGESVYDYQKGAVLPVSKGMLAIFDVKTLDVIAKIDINLDPDTPNVGFPSSLVVSDDEKVAYAGSGTSPAIFKFDLVNKKLVRGSQNPISIGDLGKMDMVSLEMGENGLIFAGSFNQDKVYAIDTTTDSIAVTPFQSIEVGKSQDMEGPIDLIFRKGQSPDLFVLLGLSNSVTAVTTVMGQGGVQNDFVKTGVYPNRLAFSEGTLYILNSGDNNIISYDVGTKKQGKQYVLPIGANPYDIAIEGKDAYVTGLLSNSLFKIELKTGQVKEIK